jgi:hypothetical protein
MTQQAKIRTSLDDARPIHHACLVAGCLCRADANGPARIGAIVPAVARAAETSRAALDRTWRFVGLPVA